MYECFLDDTHEDAVIVRLPYLSHNMQYDHKQRTGRAKALNDLGKVVHRPRHELGVSTGIRAVLLSGNPKVAHDGFRSVYYRITFPGVVLTDKVYGSDGKLNLNLMAHKSTKGVTELTFDIHWHVKIDEDSPRYYQFGDETEKEKPDALAAAMEGMNLGEDEDDDGNAAADHIGSMMSY